MATIDKIPEYETYREIVDEFITDPALSILLISGNIGVGKTFFIKDYIKENSRPSSYLNAIRFTSNNIEQELYNGLSDKGEDGLKKIASALSKVTGEIVQLGMDYIKNTIDYSNHLIIIDEIDRIPEKMSLQQIFAEVIYLKEKFDGIKIIMITTTEDEKNEYFQNIREKLFDKELNFNPKLKSPSFITETEDKYQNRRIVNKYQMLEKFINKKWKDKNKDNTDFLKKVYEKTFDLYLSIDKDKNNELKNLEGTLTIDGVDAYESIFQFDNAINEFFKCNNEPLIFLINKFENMNNNYKEGVEKFYKDYHGFFIKTNIKKSFSDIIKTIHSEYANLHIITSESYPLSLNKLERQDSILNWIDTLNKINPKILDKNMNKFKKIIKLKFKDYSEKINKDDIYNLSIINNNIDIFENRLQDEIFNEIRDDIIKNLNVLKNKIKLIIGKMDFDPKNLNSNLSHLFKEHYENNIKDTILKSLKSETYPVILVLRNFKTHDIKFNIEDVRDIIRDNVKDPDLHNHINTVLGL